MYKKNHWSIVFSNKPFCDFYVMWLVLLGQAYVTLHRLLKNKDLYTTLSKYLVHITHLDSIYHVITCEF